MAVLKKIKSHPGVVDYFKELPFYNKHIKKRKIKLFKNVDLLSEPSFYEELSIIKTKHAFRGYAMRYKFEFVGKKDPIGQLEASKSSIDDLLNNLLNEAKCFKYQITLKATLKKVLKLNLLQFI